MSIRHDSLMILDTGYRVAYWSGGAEALYGWGAGEAAGKDIRRLLQTRSPVPPAEVRRILSARGFWEGELENTRKDGSVVRVACRLTLERKVRGRPATLLAIHDAAGPRRPARHPSRTATGRVEAPDGRSAGLERVEEDLRQAKERLEMAHRAAGAGTWDWDIPTGRLSWCDHLFRLFGLDPGKSAASFDAWRDILHPEDREAASARIQQALQHHTDLASEYRIVRPDGQVRWIDARGRGEYDSRGNPVRMLGICIDVTEKRRAQMALEESAGVYRAIGESIDFGVWVCAPDGRNIYASESFLKLVGQTQEQCSNFGWGDVLHPDDAERTIAAWKECVRTGGQWDIEHRYRGVDGKWHPVLARGVPVRNKQGEITCWAGINLDISSLKQAQEALESARQEAVNEKNRLEAVMEALPVGMVITDAQGGTHYANRMYDEIWGGTRPRTDQIGDYAAYKAWWADSKQPVRPEEWASAQAVQQGRTVIGQLMEIQRFDGERRLILNSAAPVLDAFGKVTASAVAIQDVTELRRMEEALRESEERYRTVFRTMSEGFSIHEVICGEDGTPCDYLFLEVNPAFERLTGLKRADVIGRTVREVLPGEDPYWIHRFGEVALTGQSAHFVNYSAALGRHYEVVAFANAPRQFAVLFMDVTEQKKSVDRIEQLNRELRRKVQELETVFETVPIGIAIAEDPEGRHIHGNPANEELLGVGPGGELSLRRTADRAPARYRPMQDGRELPVDELPMQRAVRGERVNGQILEVTRQDGCRVTLLSHAAPLFDESGRPRGAVGAFLDISDLKQAEGALRASEARYRSLVELSPDAIVVHQEGRFVYANPSALRLYSAEATERFIGRSVLELIHPDDRELVARRMEAAYHQGIAPKQELRMLRLDGQSVPVESAAFPMTFQDRPAVTVIIRDITERKRLEAERLELERLKVLSDSRKLWQDTFDAITDLISIHERDLSVKRANRAFLEYFGWSAEEAIGKKCGELFHAAGAPAADCPLEESLATMAPASGEVTDARRSRVFEVHTFPLSAGADGFSGCIQIAKDITEKRESEIRLIVSERLAAVGQLAAGVAHEINNPLATISGCAEGLLSRIDGPHDPEGTREYLEIIREEVLRCKSITDGMLSFVRQASYEIRPVQMNEAVERSIEMMRLQGRLQNVELMRDFASDLPPVRVRQGDLMQVFLAIFSNALDAVEDRGVIQVRTGMAEGQVFVEVQDSGPGIPPEYAEKIFDLFFTTKSTQGGTGIGLPIARKLVGAMSGQLTLEPGPGTGAAFRVALPGGSFGPAGRG